MAKKPPRLKMLKPQIRTLQPKLNTLKSKSWTDEGRGSRHERGYGTAWDKLRKRILERDCGICQPCQARGLVHQATEVDHKVGKAEWQALHGTLAGVDDPANLQSICRDAHREKTAAESSRARSGWR